MQVLYPGLIGIWRCWFLWRKENRRTRRKTLGARIKPTTNSTHVWHQAGIEPRSHWWETSSLTTAPSLPLELIIHKLSIKLKGSPYALSVVSLIVGLPKLQGMFLSAFCWKAFGSARKPRKKSILSYSGNWWNDLVII